MNYEQCPACGGPVKTGEGSVWCDSPPCDWSIMGIVSDHETKAIQIPFFPSGNERKEEGYHSGEEKKTGQLNHNPHSPESLEYNEVVRGNPTANRYNVTEQSEEKELKRHNKDAMSAYDTSTGGALVPPPAFSLKPKSWLGDKLLLPPKIKRKSLRQESEAGQKVLPTPEERKREVNRFLDYPMHPNLSHEMEMEREGQRQGSDKLDAAVAQSLRRESHDNLDRQKKIKTLRSKYKSQVDEEKIAFDPLIDLSESSPQSEENATRVNRGLDTVNEQMRGGEVPREMREGNRPKKKSLSIETKGTYSGRITDALGREVCFAAGKRVACTKSPEVETEPRRGRKLVSRRNIRQSRREQEEETSPPTRGSPAPPQEGQKRPGQDGQPSTFPQTNSGLSPTEPSVNSVKIGTTDNIIGYGYLLEDGTIQWDGNMEAIQSILDSLDPSLQGADLLTFLVQDSVDRWWATTNDEEELQDGGENDPYYQ